METQLPIIRNKLIDKSLLYAIAFIYPLLFASLIRFYYLGWHPIFYFHIAFAIGLTIVYFNRAKLSVKYKTICFSTCFFLFSFVGSLFFGLASAMFFYLLVVTINTIIFDYKAGAIVMGTAIIGIGISALLHSSGLIEIRVNLNDYCTSLNSWISYMLALIFVFLVTIITVYTYNKFFISNIAALKDKIKEQAIAQKKLNEAYLKLEEQNQMLQKLNIEFKAAKNKAKESNRLKSAFLCNMSQEIRTPMNGILGFAELLKTPKLSGKEQLKYIKVIEKSGARMLNIINNIVSISRIESGVLEVNLTEININNELQFVYDSQIIDARNKNLNLSFNCTLADEEAIIETDSEKFNSILSNMVKNAIKYTEKGMVEFGCSKGGKEIEFYVKDTGIGIQKEKQEAIFERFTQAVIEDKMARQGAGLGLAIARAYVEILEGKIWLESEVGKGSTFFFTIPRNNNIKKKKSEPVLSNIKEN